MPQKRKRSETVSEVATPSPDGDTLLEVKSECLETVAMGSDAIGDTSTTTSADSGTHANSDPNTDTNTYTNTATLNSDILFLLLPLVDHGTLIALRATCRRFRKLSDRLLARHIVIRPFSSPSILGYNGDACLAGDIVPRRVCQRLNFKDEETRNIPCKTKDITLTAHKDDRDLPAVPLDFDIPKAEEGTDIGWSQARKAFEKSRAVRAWFDNQITRDMLVEYYLPCAQVLADFIDNEVTIRHMLEGTRCVDFVNVNENPYCGVGFLVDRMSSLTTVRLVGRQDRILDYSLTSGDEGNNPDETLVASSAGFGVPTVINSTGPAQVIIHRKWTVPALSWFGSLETLSNVFTHERCSLSVRTEEIVLVAIPEPGGNPAAIGRTRPIDGSAHWVHPKTNVTNESCLVFDVSWLFFQHRQRANSCHVQTLSRWGCDLSAKSDPHPECNLTVTLAGLANCISSFPFWTDGHIGDFKRSVILSLRGHLQQQETEGTGPDRWLEEDIMRMRVMSLDEWREENFDEYTVAMAPTCHVDEVEDEDVSVRRL